MPPVSARSTDGITDCIHDSLRQPDLQSRRVRLTSPVLQAAALAGTNYPLLPLFMQSPHQPLLQEGGPAPTTDGLILHQVSVPLGARSPMGSFCPAPTSYRGCFSPPCQHRQLQALLSTLEKPAREAADKEALRLPDKAARHLWGSCHRRWHGQPGQAGRGRSARHGAVGDPGSPAPASDGTADGPVLLCERAPRWGSYLPPAGAGGEAGAAPVPADVCPACRCRRGAGGDATREPRGPWPCPLLGARGS